MDVEGAAGSSGLFGSSAKRAVEVDLAMTERARGWGAEGIGFVLLFTLARDDAGRRVAMRERNGDERGGDDDDDEHG